jgi:predicted TIM-barrel fold metal-dependent hydrolase
MPQAKASGKSRKRRGEPRAIDFHVHLGRVFSRHPGLTAAALVRFMDRNKIDKCVVLPIENPEETDLYFTTDQVLDEIRRHRSRLIPFCNIDPRRVYPGRFNPEPLLKEYVKKGCRGLGEILAGLPVDSPLTDRLYAVCEDLRLPVLLHFDNWINRDSLGLKGFAKVLRKHPKLVFVAHGPAFWREISSKLKRSDGYPGGKVFPGGAADRLLRDRPNLYADLSAGSGYNAVSRDPEFGYDFLERQAKKLLFATDYLRPGQETPIVEFMRRAPLEDSTRRAIMSANAEKLLRL